jgi:hypothetical protein
LSPWLLAFAEPGCLLCRADSRFQLRSYPSGPAVRLRARL